MSQWPLVDLPQLTDSSVIPWWLPAPQGIWYGCRAQCNPLGPGTTAPARPGLGLGLGLGPGSGPGPCHHAIYSPLSYCPCWLLTSVFSLGSQGTTETSNIFPLWFPLEKRKKTKQSCAPAVFNVFQWGYNRKKTKTSPRWI